MDLNHRPSHYRAPYQIWVGGCAWIRTRDLFIISDPAQLRLCSVNGARVLFLWWLFTTPVGLTLAKNPDPDQRFTPSCTPSFARSRLEGADFAISRLNTRFFPLTPRKIKVRLHYGKGCSAPRFARRSASRGVASGGSAFSFRPAISFCSSWGG